MIQAITASSWQAHPSSQSAPGGRSLSNNFSLDRPVFAVAFLSPPSICPSKYYSLYVLIRKRGCSVQRSQNCYWLLVLCLLCLLEAIACARVPPSAAVIRHRVNFLSPQSYCVVTPEDHTHHQLYRPIYCIGVCAVDHPAVLRRTAIVCTVSFFQDQSAYLIVDHPVPFCA